MKIWFWQLIISPHMAGLAKALADLGADVAYVAREEMSQDRTKQGWQVPCLGKVEFKLAPSVAVAKVIAAAAPDDAIHICQGIRGNGQIGEVQKTLTQLGRKQWVVMETVDDGGWQGLVKKLMYRYMLRRMEPHLQGVLATGRATPDWMVSRGVDKRKVFPFAYFLQEVPLKPSSKVKGKERFRFLFVGQFIERKCLDVLIGAVASIKHPDVELAVVGSGPLEQKLREQAERRLPKRVDWVGRLPMHEVREQMAIADCLVLPSRHDGWGAVVSEALMAGTPVVCSDACGASEVVSYSGVGGVFHTGDSSDLISCLQDVVANGKPSDIKRNEIATWAKSLGCRQGASYLLKVLGSDSGDISPPWR